MAWRFPAVLPVDGDILHPAHWNENIDVYSSEINGFIDRDNLKKNSITTGTVNRNTFIKVFSHMFEDTKGAMGDPANDFDINMRTSAWQSTDTSPDNDPMPFIEMDADVDGWVECDFHASYQWRLPDDPSGGSQAWFRHNEDTIVIKGLGSAHFDGSGRVMLYHEISELHGNQAPVVVQENWNTTVSEGWSEIEPYPIWYREGDYKIHNDAAVPIKGKFLSDGVCETPNDVDCVAFRLLVDGNTVSESGWMSIGMYRNGIHLTGAAPISAGKHRIETQVRVGKVDAAAATSGGLAEALSLSFVEVVSEMMVRNPPISGKCRVRARGLTVLYRKR